MSSRAQYYWRQADICMRLSLLSDDNEVAELLINKAIELMSQAETAAADGGDGVVETATIDVSLANASPADTGPGDD